LVTWPFCLCCYIYFNFKHAGADVMINIINASYAVRSSLSATAGLLVKIGSCCFQRYSETRSTKMKMIICVMTYVDLLPSPAAAAGGGPMRSRAGSRGQLGEARSPGLFSSSWQRTTVDDVTVLRPLVAVRTTELRPVVAVRTTDTIRWWTRVNDVCSVAFCPPVFCIDLANSYIISL